MTNLKIGSNVTCIDGDEQPRLKGRKAVVKDVENYDGWQIVTVEFKGRMNEDYRVQRLPGSLFQES